MPNWSNLCRKIALAAIVCAPAGWASEHKPQAEVRSGLLVQTMTPPNSSSKEDPSKLVTLKDLNVSVEVEGLIARTTVKKVYQNCADAPARIAFAFPIPKDAAIDRFAMTVLNENDIIEGTVLPVGEARTAYRQIVDDRISEAEQRRNATAAGGGGGGSSGAVIGGSFSSVSAGGVSAASGMTSMMSGTSTDSSGRTSIPFESTYTGPSNWPSSDPGLLELAGPSACRMFVYPIEAKKTKTIVVTYVQSLAQPAASAGRGLLEYTFPLQPFSTGATEKTHTHLSARSRGAVRLMKVSTPVEPVLSMREDNILASLDFDGVEALKGAWTVQMDSAVAAKVHDAGCGVQVHRKSAREAGLLAATIVPQAHFAARPLDVLFVVDLSERRLASERENALSFLRASLEQLPQDARFNIAALHRETTNISGAWLGANAESTGAAMKLLEQVSPAGNGDLAGGLNELAARITTDKDRDVRVVLIGDWGGAGAEKAAASANEAWGAEWFVVRNTSAPELSNSRLLERVTATSVLDLPPGGDAKILANLLVRDLATPIVRNAKFTLTTADGKTTELQAPNLVGLPAGRTATVYGSYLTVGAASLTLTGTLRGEPFEQKWRIELPETSTANSVLQELHARASSESATTLTGEAKAEQTSLSRSILSRRSGFIVTDSHPRYQSYGLTPSGQPAELKCDWILGK
ncbi:MAG TPA: VIT and VWA domain-containing protein [Planctomycetota bacterium]|nr:VIT and VWA domain-containing protein [Planctomycetota bacterium]